MAADFFRLEDGKIVEHWDVLQLPDTSANEHLDVLGLVSALVVDLSHEFEQPFEVAELVVEVDVGAAASWRSVVMPACSRGGVGRWPRSVPTRLVPSPMAAGTCRRAASLSPATRRWTSRPLAEARRSRRVVVVRRPSPWRRCGAAVALGGGTRRSRVVGELDADGDGEVEVGEGSSPSSRAPSRIGSRNTSCGLGEERGADPPVGELAGEAQAGRAEGLARWAGAPAAQRADGTAFAAGERMS